MCNIRCCTFLSLVISLAVSTDCQTAPAKVSAAEIVDRNVSARDGLAAWRAVQTVFWKGKADAGGGDSGGSKPQTCPGRVAPTSRMAYPDTSNAEDKADAGKQVQLPFVFDRWKKSQLSFAMRTWRPTDSLRAQASKIFSPFPCRDNNGSNCKPVCESSQSVTLRL